MTAEELKPCPFCNGKDDLQISEIPSRDGAIVWVSIHHGPSRECSVKMMADSEEKVIQLWNRRDYTFTIAEKAVGEERNVPYAHQPERTYQAAVCDRILSRIKTEIGGES